MSKDRLSNNPKDLRVENNQTNSRAWFCEEGKGLEIIVETPTYSRLTGQMYNEYVHVLISWRTILASVGRYLRKK